MYKFILILLIISLTATGQSIPVVKPILNPKPVNSTIKDISLLFGIRDDEKIDKLFQDKTDTYWILKHRYKPSSSSLYRIHELWTFDGKKLTLQLDTTVSLNKGYNENDFIKFCEEKNTLYILLFGELYENNYGYDLKKLNIHCYDINIINRQLYVLDSKGWRKLEKRMKKLDYPLADSRWGNIAFGNEVDIDLSSIFSDSVSIKYEFKYYDSGVIDSTVYSIGENGINLSNKKDHLKISTNGFTIVDSLLFVRVPGLPVLDIYSKDMKRIRRIDFEENINEIEYIQYDKRTHSLIMGCGFHSKPFYHSDHLVYYNISDNTLRILKDIEFDDFNPIFIDNYSNIIFYNRPYSIHSQTIKSISLKTAVPFVDNFEGFDVFSNGSYDLFDVFGDEVYFFGIGSIKVYNKTLDKKIKQFGYDFQYESFYAYLKLIKVLSSNLILLASDNQIWVYNLQTRSIVYSEQIKLKETSLWIKEADGITVIDAKADAIKFKWDGKRLIKQTDLSFNLLQTKIGPIFKNQSSNKYYLYNNEIDLNKTVFFINMNDSALTEIPFAKYILNIEEGNNRKNLDSNLVYCGMFKISTPDDRLLINEYKSEIVNFAYQAELWHFSPTKGVLRVSDHKGVYWDERNINEFIISSSRFIKINENWFSVAGQGSVGIVGAKSEEWYTIDPDFLYHSLKTRKIHLKGIYGDNTYYESNGRNKMELPYNIQNIRLEYSFGDINYYNTPIFASFDYLHPLKQFESVKPNTKYDLYLTESNSDNYAMGTYSSFPLKNNSYGKYEIIVKEATLGDLIRDGSIYLYYLIIVLLGTLYFRSKKVQTLKLRTELFGSIGHDLTGLINDVIKKYESVEFNTKSLNYLKLMINGYQYRNPMSSVSDVIRYFEEWFKILADGPIKTNQSKNELNRKLKAYNDVPINSVYIIFYNVFNNIRHHFDNYSDIKNSENRILVNFKLDDDKLIIHLKSKLTKAGSRDDQNIYVRKVNKRSKVKNSEKITGTEIIIEYAKLNRIKLFAEITDDYLVQKFTINLEIIPKKIYDPLY